MSLETDLESECMFFFLSSFDYVHKCMRERVCVCVCVCVCVHAHVHCVCVSACT